MMIVTAWLVNCLIIAAVFAAGAAAWEAAARWSGRPTRWSWVAALAGSVTVPWLLRLLPDRGDVIPSAVPVLTLDPIGVMAETVLSGYSMTEYALFAWAVLSLAMVAYVAQVLRAVSRGRRCWRETEVDGARVWVSRDVGPAAVGLRDGMVVVPAWVLELRADLRDLLLRHEREHLSAGDPRLLFAGLMLVAAMPWNPVLWYALLRLRNAIELDCDVRVLASGAHPQRYGSLLLEVGLRRSRGALVMATFAEPRVYLEQRIRRIAQWPVQRRPARALVFGVTALALFATALSARDPFRASFPAEPEAPASDDVRESDDVAPIIIPSDAIPMAVDTPPVRGTVTPVTVQPELLNAREVYTALLKAYPPVLRDAGIGGRATVWVFVGADGLVQQVRLSKTSGYPALDEGALSVAKAMRFSPALNRQKKVAVWVELPVVFTANKGAEIDVSGQRTPLLDRPAMEVRERTRAPLGRPVAGGDARAVRIREQVALEQAAAARQQAAAGKPQTTSLTKQPELTNAAEVERALVQSYPPMLRDAGIGGRPVVWVYIGADGSVLQVRLSRGSGYPALDEAAVRLARTFRFTPPLKGDERVAAWIEIPIVFSAK